MISILIVILFVVMYSHVPIFLVSIPLMVVIDIQNKTLYWYVDTLWIDMPTLRCQALNVQIGKTENPLEL